MLVKIDQYVQENPSKYNGYFAKGLFLLDAFIDSRVCGNPGDLDGPETIGKYFSDALKQIGKPLTKVSMPVMFMRVVKYYFISLILQKNKSTLKKVKTFIKKSGKQDRQCSLMIDLLQYAVDGKAFLLDYRQLDDTDWLMLWAYERSFERIRGAKPDNYLYRSVKAGRKSNQLLETVYAHTDISGCLTKKDVRVYPQLILRNRYWKNYKKLTRWLKEVTAKNYELVEKTLTYVPPSKKTQKLFQKYITYRLFYNIWRTEAVFDDGYDRCCPVMRLLADGVNPAVYHPEISAMLSRQIHFSEAERCYLSHNPDAMVRRHLYTVQIEFPYPVERRREKIIFSFDAYQPNLNTSYYPGIQSCVGIGLGSGNYYFLPESPKHIYLKRDGDSVEEVQFLAEQMNDDAPPSDYPYRFAERLNQTDRVRLFIVVNQECVSHNQNLSYINPLLSNSDLFDRRKYVEAISAATVRIASIGDPDTASALACEHAAVSFDVDAVHLCLLYVTDVIEVNRIFGRALDEGMEVSRDSFFSVVNRFASQEYNLDFARLCERYVYMRQHINKAVCSYLHWAYIKRGLYTVMTQEVIELLRSYGLGGEEEQEHKCVYMSLYASLQTEGISSIFYSDFRRAYEMPDRNDRIWRDCVNKMLETEHYGQEIYAALEILEAEYRERTEKDPALLEFIAFHRIKTTAASRSHKAVQPDFADDLIALYQKQAAVSRKAMSIFSWLIKHRAEEAVDIVLPLYRREPALISIIHENVEIFAACFEKLDQDKDIRNIVYDFCLEKDETDYPHILRAYIHERGEQTVRAYKLLVGSLLKTNAEEAEHCIEEYLQADSSMTYAEGMLGTLAKVKMERAVELSEKIREKKPDVYRITARRLLEEALLQNEIDLGLRLFERTGSTFEQKPEMELLIQYLRACPRICDGKMPQTLRRIFADPHVPAEFKASVADELADKLMDHTDARLVMNIWMDTRNPDLGRVIAKYGCRCDDLPDDLFQLLLEGYAASEEEQPHFEEFVKKNLRTRPISRERLRIVLSSFDHWLEHGKKMAQIDMFLEDLQDLSEARSVIENKNNPDHTIIHQYYRDGSEKPNALIALRWFDNLFTGRRRQLLYVSDEYMEVFQSYMDTIADCFVSNYYVCNEILSSDEYCENPDSEIKRIKIMADIARLRILLLEKGFSNARVICDDPALTDYVIIDHVTIPEKIHIVPNKGVRKKSAKKSTIASKSENDLNQREGDWYKKLVKSQTDLKKYQTLYDILENENYGNILDFLQALYAELIHMVTLHHK